MCNGIADPFTNAAVDITGDHHYTHLGKGYVLVGATASIAAAGVEHISFKTPTASRAIVHFRPAKFSSRANSMSLTLIEGAVMTGGTAAVPRNKNRMAPDASGVVAATGATLTTAGSKTIYWDEVGTGGVTNRAGGSGGSDEELVLKPDTVYCLTFTNTGATTASVATYTLAWYEE
jgi:hypothetical protein